ncbi:MAG: aminotransferase class V-fold PLP-dependent enzyme [Propionibacteriaceae bacterium]
MIIDESLASSAWSLDPGVRHLNHGSFGAVPRAVQRRQNELRATFDADPVRHFPDLPRRVGQARGQLAAALGVAAEHTALVPNASAGASVVFANLPMVAGQEILVTDHGYGAVVMGAERLARRVGASVRVARVPLGAGPEEACAAVLAELTPRTGLVVVDQITSPTARLLPVGAITAGAHARGVPVLVDGAHAPGLIADPLGDHDADFWVGNLHKWMCAPRGTALLVARSELRHDLYPLIDSWGGREAFPERFDHQGTQDLSAWLAAPDSVRFIESGWGWEVARARMSELADTAEDLVAAAFGSFTGEDHRVDVGMKINSMRLVRLPDGLLSEPAAAHDLRVRTLDELGVAAAYTHFDRTGHLRLSAHVYNTEDDYADFAERCVPALCAWADRR